MICMLAIWDSLRPCRETSSQLLTGGFPSLSKTTKRGNLHKGSRGLFVDTRMWL